MLALTVALALAPHQIPQTPAPRENQTPDPVILVQKMLANYYNAKSMRGEILLTTVAGQERGQVRTQFQYSDSSKLFIQQELQTAAARDRWLVVSDAKTFAYPIPQGQLGSDTRKMLIEPVERAGVALSYRDIYAITSLSLKDRNAPLDIAIGRYADLQFLKSQWATFEYKGTETLRGLTAHVVEGLWRPYGKGTVCDKYRMWITDQNQLLQYSLEGIHTFVAGNGRSTGPIEIRQIWEVDLHPEAKIDDSLYLSR